MGTTTASTFAAASSCIPGNTCEYTRALRDHVDGHTVAQEAARVRRPPLPIARILASFTPSRPILRLSPTVLNQGSEDPRCPQIAPTQCPQRRRLRPHWRLRHSPSRHPQARRVPGAYVRSGESTTSSTSS